MIQVITSNNQHIYGKQLDQMFRMRHEYYVVGHGWEGLKSRDGRETDEFDNLEAVYLISVDFYGDVAASLRLNPTTGPTLLQKFAEYSDSPLPQSPSCWDLSRWIARPDQRRADGSRWPSNHQRKLALGVLEFCQSRGADCLTMLCETRLAERIGAYGWPVEYLGAPRDYEGGKGSAVAARINIGDHVLSMTRAKTRIVQPVLFEIEAEAPGAVARALAAATDISVLVQKFGPEHVRALVGKLAAGLAHHPLPEPPVVGDRPAALAVLAAFNRMLERAGAGIDLSPTVEEPVAGPTRPAVDAPRRGAGRGGH